MAYFGWLSGQVARNSEPYMRQVFVTGDIEDEDRLSRQVRLPERRYIEHKQTALNVKSMNSQCVRELRFQTRYLNS